ncbi:MAG: dTMP kinase [Verrucomicrobiae bacterium]|nr:dTMP kinase [Verrucomicrobiae bacterium]
MRGTFISFEGGEGCGKSTQVRRLAARLEKMGRKVLVTREPGGTPLGETIRHLLKHSPQTDGVCPESELFLFAAARAQLVRSVILPALAKKMVVLSDRFHDSTTVYQGMVRGVDPKLVAAINWLAVGECVPRLTIVLDIPVAEGRRRLMRRVRPVGGERDRFEEEPLGFHRQVARGYLRLAEAEPKRIKVVDGRGTPDEVEAAIWEHVKHVL